MVARGDGSSLDVNEMNAKHPPPTGDHEGPPLRMSMLMGGLLLHSPNARPHTPPRGSCAGFPRPCTPWNFASIDHR